MRIGTLHRAGADAWSANRTRVVLTAGVIIGGLVLAAAVLLSSIHVMRVTSGSMFPATQAGDWVVVGERDEDAASWVRRGDMVVFAFPAGSEQRAIKRVIGLPGDRIVIRERAVAVNGRIFPVTGAPDEAAGLARTALVPARSLFVLGDNAIHSIDSRSFGPVRETEIFGRVLFPVRPWLVWLVFGALTSVWVGAFLRPTNGLRWRDT